MTGSTITLRPMQDTRADYIALQSWFHEPELCRWVWCDQKNEPPVSLERVTEKYRPRITAPTDVFPYFILKSGEPIGFIQYYIQNAASAGLDMWIGIRSQRGSGIGTEALRQMTGLIHERHPEITELFIDPEPDNLPAVRCYEKAGFRTVGTIEDDGAECLLMKYYFAEGELSDE